MKPINYPELVRGLRVHHHSFFDKYSAYVEKNLGERNLERGTLLARLNLIAKAMCEAGVISGFSEADILNHSCSLMLHAKVGTEPFYLLNDCTDLIAVCGGIASIDTFSGRLVLVHGEENSGKTTFFKRYHNVLAEDFNWDTLAHEILEAIHKALYNKSDVQKDRLKAELFND